MKHDGDLGAPFVSARPARRLFGFGSRGGRAQDVAAPEAATDRATERPGFGVSTGVIFFLGLGITACGILLARSESQFQWFPPGLQVTFEFLLNRQAVLVGAAVTLIGAVVTGLAARRAPERTGLAVPSTEYRVPSGAEVHSVIGTRYSVLAPAPALRRSVMRRDLVLAIGALALAAGCTALLYWHLVPAGKLYTHWDILPFFASLALTAFAVHRLDRGRTDFGFWILDFGLVGAVRPNPKSKIQNPKSISPWLPAGDDETASGYASALSGEVGGADARRDRIFTPLDWLAAVGLGLFAGALSMIDLTRWDFAWVGDEGSFFTAAGLMASGDWQAWKFFDLRGVFGAHPILDTLLQTPGIKVFGYNAVGWRMSEVLLLAVATGLTYLATVALLGDRLGRLPAIAAAVFMGSSHYLMAFGRIAYNNVHVVFYGALVLLMLGLAWRRRNAPGHAVYFLGLGMALGFCLYTFRPAVLIWPIVALALAPAAVAGVWAGVGGRGYERQRGAVGDRSASRPDPRAGVLLTEFGPLLLGFLMVVVPAFLVTPPDQFISNSVHNTYLNFPGQDVKRAFWIGLGTSMMSFWVNRQWLHHLVGGPLVDMVSGVLLAAGLFIALFRVNRPVERLALSWIVLGILMVSVTDFSPQPHTTRLHVLMPAAALLVGMAVWAVDAMLRGAFRLWAPAARAITLGLLIAVPPLNLYQLLVDTPNRVSQSAFILMLRAMREHPDAQMIQVGTSPQPDGNMADIFLHLYPELTSRYGYVGVDQLANPIQSVKGNKWPYFMVSSDEGPIHEEVAEKLRDGYTEIVMQDPIKSGTLWLYQPRPWR